MLFAAGAAFKTLSQLTTAEFVPRRLLLLMTDESAAQPFTASDAEAFSLTLPARRCAADRRVKQYPVPYKQHSRSARSKKVPIFDNID